MNEYVGLHTAEMESGRTVGKSMDERSRAFFEERRQAVSEAVEILMMAEFMQRVSPGILTVEAARWSGPTIS